MSPDAAQRDGKNAVPRKPRVNCDASRPVIKIKKKLREVQIGRQDKER